MPYAPVQAASHLSSVSETSASVSLAQNPTPGNTLVLIINAGATFGVPKGYTAVTSAPVDYLQTGIYYRAVTGATPGVASVTLGASSAVAMRLFEFAGIIGLDAATSSRMVSATAASIASGSVTAQGANGLAIAVVGSLAPSSSLNSGGVATWSNGFSSVLSVLTSVPASDNDRLDIATSTLGGPGAVSTTATFSQGSGSWHANSVLAVFEVQAPVPTVATHVTTKQLRVAGAWSPFPVYVRTGSNSWVPQPSAGSTVPGAPTGVSASAGDGQASVYWSAPSDNGGSVITGYSVVSTPGGITVAAGGSATQATVTGLSNGTSYTFKVRASNAVGDSPQSAASSAVTPTASASVISDGRDVTTSNVGYRGTLTKHTGDWYTSDGLPNGLEITGQLVIDAKITGVMQDFWAYKGIKQQFNATGSTFEHFELGSPGSVWSGDYGAIYGGYTMRYFDIHGFSDGVHVNGDVSTPTLLEWGYIHDLIQGNAADHNDGIQMTNGANTTIRGVRINRNDGFNQTSCIIVGADAGNISNVTIEKCYFEASISNFQVALYWGHDTGSSWTASGYVLRNNWFKKNTFTILVSANDSYTSLNNKYLDGTTAIADGTF